MKIGSKILEARYNANLTREDLASKIEISPVRLQQYEEQNVYPDSDVVEKLNKILKLDLAVPREKKEEVVVNDYVGKCGEYIRSVRTEKGIAQTKMAKNIGLPPGYISRYENGYEIPDIKRILKIIDYLKLDRVTALGLRLQDIQLKGEGKQPKPVDKLASRTLISQRMKTWHAQNKKVKTKMKTKEVVQKHIINQRDKETMDTLAKVSMRKIFEANKLLSEDNIKMKRELKQLKKENEKVLEETIDDEVLVGLRELAKRLQVTVNELLREFVKSNPKVIVEKKLIFGQ